MKVMKYLSLCLPLLVVFPACSGSDEAADPSSENEDSDNHDEANETDDEAEIDNPRPPNRDGGVNEDAGHGGEDNTGNETSDETPEDESTDDSSDDQTTDDNSDDESSDDETDATDDTTNPQDTTDDEGDELPDQGPVNAAHFFLPTPEPDNTAAPHIRVDAEGGVHAAYPTFVGGGAYYAYCAPGCDSETDVQVVHFETELTVLNALIELDGQGRPRVLLSSWDGLYYAECNDNCTEQTAWQQGMLLKHDNKLEVTGESFAIDPDGNPHFLLHAYVELFGVGQGKDETHYATCKSDCTAGDNWVASLIVPEIWEGGTLRFDADGTAHIFASAVRYEVGVPSSWVPVYATCSEGCDSAEASWSKLELNYEVYQDREKALSMRPATSMELTTEGKPRLLSIFEGQGEDERMVTYLECDELCTEGNEKWGGTVISNNPNLAAGIDIALDVNDRPRVVYNLGYNIFMASCNSGTCSSAPTEWAIEPVELTSEMPPDEIILWPNCNVDAWFLHNPMIAMGADGKPRVAYQASDISGGGVADPDPNQTPCLAGTDLSWSRMTTIQ